MATAASTLSFRSSMRSGSPLALQAPASSSVSSLPRRLSPVASAVAAPVHLESRSLGELRALARQRGLRGDTRAELIQLLSSATPTSAALPTPNGAASASPNGAAAAPAPAAARGVDVRALQSMPLAQLRAVARSRGVLGLQTREQIIQALKGGSAPPASPSPAAPSPVPATPVAPPPVTSVVSSSNPGVSRQQLMSKSVPALRAMARSKGVANYTGLNKELLIQALVSKDLGPPTTAAPSPPPPSSSGGDAAAPQADLSSLSLAELRSLGKQHGVRGDTRSELVSLLSRYTGAVLAAAASAPEKTAVPAVAFAEPLPETLPLESASGVSLPPFQSDVPEEGVAVERVQLASEVSALRKALEEIEQRDKTLGAEKDSLVEQANFLRNVLVGSVGLAVLPLLLPFQTPLTAPSRTPQPTPVAVVEPPAPPAPVVREVSPQDYCAAVPANLLSAQVARFCEALIEPTV